MYGGSNGLDEIFKVLENYIRPVYKYVYKFIINNNTTCNFKNKIFKTITVLLRWKRSLGIFVFFKVLKFLVLFE